MAINGFAINGSGINGNASAPEEIVLAPFTSATVASELRLGLRLQIGIGLTETFSRVGLFVWNSGDRCKFEDLFATNADTEFDSIRDDGNNNRRLEQKLRCITGVEVEHMCILGDKT